MKSGAYLENMCPFCLWTCLFYVSQMPGSHIFCHTAMLHAE